MIAARFEKKDALTTLLPRIRSSTVVLLSAHALPARQKVAASTLDYRLEAGLNPKTESLGSCKATNQADACLILEAVVFSGFGNGLSV